MGKPNASDEDVKTSVLDDALTAHTETLLTQANDAKKTLDELQQATTDLDGSHIVRTAELDERERKVQSKEAALNAREGKITTRETDLSKAEEEVAVADTGSNSTAQNLILREEAVSKREADISQREYKADLRASKAEELANDAAAAIKSIDVREAQLKKDKIELGDFAATVEAQATKNDEDRKKLMQLEQQLVAKAKGQA